MATDASVIHPKFHHVNLKTTRLQEIADQLGPEAAPIDLPHFEA